MKIISGIYGGRRLETPKNNNIRPTSDKIRGAIFNMISSRIDLKDVRILDAFCGSGALGLEGLSRGGVHCTFIDKSPMSLDLCKRNVRMLGIENQAKFYLKDSTRSLGIIANIAYDLIFVDPPYYQDLVLPTLYVLGAANMITHSALIVIETEKQWNSILPAGFKCETEKRYGDTKVTIISKV